MPKFDSPAVLLPGAAPTASTHVPPRSYVDTRAVPVGGASGQVLTKSSGTDYATGWVTPSNVPGGTAGGSLSGTYPSPGIAAGAVGLAEIAAAIKDAIAGTASLRTLGTGSTQACAGNDSRLSDTRTPASHAASHAIAGADRITPAAIGALLVLTPTAIKTANYTVAVGELALMDATAGPITVTLPAAAAGVFAGAKKVDTSANLVTVAAAGADTIGSAAAASVTIPLRDQGPVFQANGTNWVTERNYLPLPALDARYSLMSTYTTKGDLLVATASGAVSRLAVGANATLPIADTTQATGVRWGTPTGLTWSDHVETITDSASVTPNAASGLVQAGVWTCNQDSTVNAPSNPSQGQPYLLIIKANSAQRIITLSGFIGTTDDSTAAITIPSSKWCTLAFRYISSIGWLYGGRRIQV